MQANTHQSRANTGTFAATARLTTKRSRKPSGEASSSSRTAIASAPDSTRRFARSARSSLVSNESTRATSNIVSGPPRRIPTLAISCEKRNPSSPAPCITAVLSRSSRLSSPSSFTSRSTRSFLRLMIRESRDGLPVDGSSSDGSLRRRTRPRGLRRPPPRLPILGSLGFLTCAFTRSRGERTKHVIGETVFGVRSTRSSEIRKCEIDRSRSSL